VGGGGEPGHVHPDLVDDHACRGGPDPGDLIEALHRWGERGDHLLDHGVEVGDVSVQRVDPEPTRDTVRSRGRGGPRGRVLLAILASTTNDLAVHSARVNTDHPIGVS